MISSSSSSSCCDSVLLICSGVNAADAIFAETGVDAADVLRDKVLCLSFSLRTCRAESGAADAAVAESSSTSASASREERERGEAAGTAECEGDCAENDRTSAGFIVASSSLEDTSSAEREERRGGREARGVCLICS